MSASTSQAPNQAEKQQQAGTETTDQQRKPAALEEDDEFEDFPIEGMRIYRLFVSFSACDTSPRDASLPLVALNFLFSAYVD
jgi:hypothetical protein